ncbi:MAG: HlyD family efflux transporter periplasmic adaptor subunit [Desulfobacterales bacterium]|nr:HlyD family efflux transporter periplasmic adaptor subunit [Desulfobacterales bacterium]
MAEIQLGHAELKAPYAGIILSRDVEPGEVVAPNQEVLTIADLSTVDLKVFVEETEIGKVKPGQTVEVRDRHLPGQDATPAGSPTSRRRPSSRPRSSRPRRSGSSSSTWSRSPCPTPTSSSSPGCPPMPGSADAVTAADGCSPAEMIVASPGSRRDLRPARRRSPTSPSACRRGTIVGLVGSDGAGKSTLLRMIADHDPADRRHASRWAACDVVAGRGGRSRS